jgi:hypothetical protein
MRKYVSSLSKSEKERKEVSSKKKERKDVWDCIMRNGYRRRVRNVVCTDEDITNK